MYTVSFIVERVLDAMGSLIFLCLGVLAFFVGLNLMLKGISLAFGGTDVRRENRRSEADAKHEKVRRRAHRSEVSALEDRGSDWLAEQRRVEGYVPGMSAMELMKRTHELECEAEELRREHESEHGSY